MAALLIPGIGIQWPASSGVAFGGPPPMAVAASGELSNWIQSTIAEGGDVVVWEHDPVTYGVSATDFSPENRVITSQYAGQVIDPTTWSPAPGRDYWLVCMKGEYGHQPLLLVADWSGSGSWNEGEQDLGSVSGWHADLHNLHSISGFGSQCMIRFGSGELSQNQVVGVGRVSQSNSLLPSLVMVVLAVAIIVTAQYYLADAVTPAVAVEGGAGAASTGIVVAGGDATVSTGVALGDAAFMGPVAPAVVAGGVSVSTAASGVASTYTFADALAAAKSTAAVVSAGASAVSVIEKAINGPVQNTPGGAPTSAQAPSVEVLGGAPTDKPATDSTLLLVAVVGFLLVLK